MFLRCHQAQADDPFGLERYPLREREGSISHIPAYVDLVRLPSPVGGKPPFRCPPNNCRPDP